VVKSGSMTEWLDDHPGGRSIIESNKSKDVTPIFAPRHPSDQLEPQNIPPNVHHIGTLDVDSGSDEEKAELRLKIGKDEEDEQETIEKEREAMKERGLGVVVNMKDFEVCRGSELGLVGFVLMEDQRFAEPMLSKVALAYYASAGDDEISECFCRKRCRAES